MGSSPSLNYKLIALIAVIAPIILLTIVPPTIDFSSTNPFWNGYSKFISKVNPQIINTPLDKVELDPKTEILIVIPYSYVYKEELEAIKDFLDSGGIMLLMDDFKYGNEILKYLDLDIQIESNSILIDPLFNYRSGKLPLITNFEKYEETKNIKNIILNYASVLTIRGGEVDVLAYSSSFSYLDTNLNGFKDENEKPGPYPVLAKVRYGRGILYVLSDPSIIINSMIDMEGNYDLIRNIIGDRKPVLDQYHLSKNIHYELRQYILEIIRFIVNKDNLPITAALIPTLATILFIKLIRGRV